MDDPSPAWYLIVGLPVAGAAIVAAARRVPAGRRRPPPLDGLAPTPMPLSHAPGIVLAAVGTLAFGAVLGPEAPVIALGAITGAAVTAFAPARPAGDRYPRHGRLVRAPISALFGGPIVAGVMMVEAGVAGSARG